MIDIDDGTHTTHFLLLSVTAMGSDMKNATVAALKSASRTGNSTPYRINALGIFRTSRNAQEIKGNEAFFFLVSDTKHFA